MRELGKRWQEKGSGRKRSQENRSAVSVSEPGTQQKELRTHLWNDGHWQSSCEGGNE